MIHLHAWCARIYKHALLLLPEKFGGMHQAGAVPLLIACAYAVVLASWQGIKGPKVNQILTRSLQRAISTMLGVSFAILTTSHL